MTDKIYCDGCKELATWFYMPGTSKYCDNCVPRGCYCNEDIDGCQPVDELNRQYPCCEYFNIDESNNDIL